MSERSERSAIEAPEAAAERSEAGKRRKAKGFGETRPATEGRVQ